jgi:hypothetical protein
MSYEEESHQGYLHGPDAMHCIRANCARAIMDNSQIITAVRTNFRSGLAFKRFEMQMTFRSVLGGIEPNR